MEVYPAEYVTHEVPLLLLSGLGSSDTHDTLPSYPLLTNGPHLTSDQPLITNNDADLLIQAFRKRSVEGIWAGKPEHEQRIKGAIFRVRFAGREYYLPPRKANPPPIGEDGSDRPPTSDGSTRELHSPISPLSPESPLYPDGVFSHLWLRKHQSIIPAVYISAHKLYTDSLDPATEALMDSKLIASINRERRQFTAQSQSTSSNPSAEELRSTGSRTKFVVMILVDRSRGSENRQDDRLNNIRRGTNLATNQTFFVLRANSTAAEHNQYTAAMLATLHPGAIEYYRELTKHARKKRNKGSVPPPTVPSSRALSSQAWILRYEMKLGIYAEFRQEMDTAGRNYETAYEKLFSEIFETTASWSDRWKDARVISDILALRMIRCYLWLDNYAGAKAKWSYHIRRTQDILNRKGKGTETYGFAAWMSRWNQCLGDLLRLGHLPVFNTSTGIQSMLVPDMGVSLPPIYAQPPNMRPGSTPLAVQDILHHAGFYYAAAADWTARRKQLAAKINLEARDDKPDIYLCPAPADEATTDHASLEMASLVSAKEEFRTAVQKRMEDALSFRLAKLMMIKAPEQPEMWSMALRELRGIASGYRKEGWWKLLEEVLWAMVVCARNAGDAMSLVAVRWELMARGVFEESKEGVYEFGRFLEGMEKGMKPTVVVRAGEVVSFLSAGFVFATATMHVGSPAESQFVLTSNSQPSSAPVRFEKLRLTFDGGLKPIIVTHKPEETMSEQQQRVQIIDLRGKLRDSITCFETEADLKIRPGETKVFCIASVLREAGTAKITNATFEMIEKSFDLDVEFPFNDESTTGAIHPLPGSKGIVGSGSVGGSKVWWVQQGERVRSIPIRAQTPHVVTVLPRPPKMEVFPEGLGKGVYIDELVNLGLKVLNGEDDDAEVELEIKIMGWPDESVPVITWHPPSGQPVEASVYKLGTLNPSTAITLPFTFQSSSTPIDCTLEISLRYHLVSDPETPIRKTMSVEMPIINPFHATIDWSVSVHPDPWPDCFSISDDVFDSVAEKGADSKPSIGITHRWTFSATVMNVGEDVVKLENFELPVKVLSGNVDVVVTPKMEPGMVLEPTKLIHLPFTLDLRKYTFEDRSPCNLESPLLLHWRRLSSPNSPVVTTPLLLPPLYVPLREPRVLLTTTIPPTQSLSSPSPDPTLHLTYTLENPTNYFLTFLVTMESSQEFAFSGMKQTGQLNLPPLSRRNVVYRVLPFRRGEWVHPVLRVVDRTFNKTLKVCVGEGATGGTRVVQEKGGVAVWVPE